MELEQLYQTLHETTRHPINRRDLLRWSAIGAGALTAAHFGTAPASAAPARIFQDGEVQTGAVIQVPFDAFGEPVTLDPHRTVDLGGFWVMFPNVWGGLLRFTETGSVVEDLAESYTVSPDGLTWTFKLRPDAVYANGRPVLAWHFVQSWLRALNPDNPSPMVSFMQHITGYQEYLDKVEGVEVGFDALDDTTIEIRLAQPYSFFRSYLASFVWSVVDPDSIAEFGESEFFLHDAGTGPWRFTSFEPDVQFVMEPNPNHYDGVSPSITQIVWPILSGPSAASTALNMYQNDEAVSADVPLSLKGQVEGDPTLAAEMVTIEPPGTTRSLAMDFTKPPFDDVRVRRAFALAVDRERYANELYGGTWRSTTAFTPPVVTELSGYQPPEGLATNLDEARSLLVEAGFPNGEGLPEIIYYHASDDAPEEIERVRQFMAMFEESLGVTITFDDTKTLQQIDDLRMDNNGLQLALIWWQSVTETPHLLSEALRTDSPYMRGYFNWNHDLEAKGGFDPGADARQFDDLTGRADVEQDEAVRADLYRQAEDLALKNAVYAPIANWLPMFVQKPWLQGTKQGPWTGRLPVRFDKDVVVLVH